MGCRAIVVVGAVALMLAVPALVAGRSSARFAGQDTVSISAPASVRATTSFQFSVSYTIADQSEYATLWVGIEDAAAACAVTPYDAVPGQDGFDWISGQVGFPGVQLSPSGTTQFKWVQETKGSFQLCAWLDNGNSSDPALAGPAVAAITVTSPPPPPPPPVVYRGTGPLRKDGSNPTTYGFEIENGAVVNFFVNTRLPCTGTSPAVTYVDWPFPFSQTNLVRWKLSSGGSFTGSWQQHLGPLYSIRGRLVGSKLTGTFTELLHPTAANGITQNAPPHRRVTGGSCRVRDSFTAIRVRS